MLQETETTKKFLIFSKETAFLIFPEITNLNKLFIFLEVKGDGTFKHQTLKKF